MYTLRHPRDRAAALHLPPANANGLEGTWAGEGFIPIEVLGGDERQLLARPTMVKRLCIIFLP